MWAQTVCHFFLFLFTFKVSHNGRLLNENGRRLCLSPFLKKHMLQLGGCWTDAVWCKEKERNVWCEFKVCTALSQYWCYVGAVHSVQRVTGVFNMLCDTVLIITGGSWHKSFVATNICRDKSFVVTKSMAPIQRKWCLLRENIFVFVTTKVLSQQKHFLTTNIFLSWQNFCCSKHIFVATKDCLVMTNMCLLRQNLFSQQKWYLWQLSPMIADVISLCGYYICLVLHIIIICYFSILEHMAHHKAKNKTQSKQTSCTHTTG